MLRSRWPRWRSTLSATALARDLAVVSWGGAYQDAQREVVFQAVHGQDQDQDDRGELGRRRRHAARQDPGRQQQLGRRPGRVRGAAARLRGRPVRKDRLGEARRQGQVPARRGQRLRRRARSSTASSSPTTATRSKGDAPKIVGRLLEREEVAGQARAAQGPEDDARDRADGRRRCAEGRLQDARAPPAGVERAFKKLDQLKAEHGLVGKGLAAAAAARLGRGGDDRRLQRPHRRRQRQGQEELQDRLDTTTSTRSTRG